MSINIKLNNNRYEINTTQTRCVTDFITQKSFRVIILILEKCKNTFIIDIYVAIFYYFKYNLSNL